jgi:hypothetical protein
MNFNDIKNTILQHAEQYSGAAKILFTVESLIEEQQIIERLTYPVFMDLTIDFIEKKFQQLKFANLDSLLIDLRFAKGYLAKQISAKQLEDRRVIAWKLHDKLSNPAQYAQRLTIGLLYPSILDNQPDPSDQDTALGYILDYLSCINDELAILYYWKLYKNLPN